MRGYVAEAHRRLLSDFDDDVIRVDVDVEKSLQVGLKSQVNACVEVESVIRNMLFLLEYSQKLIYNV